MIIICYKYYKNLFDNIIEVKNKEIEEKENIIQEHNYNGEIQLKHHFNSQNNDDVGNYAYQIPSKGWYRICVYGSKAKEGGKGGRQCADHLFKEGSNITFYWEGQNSGGKGGKGCGFLGNGKGYNGGGLSKAEFGKEFLIIAGGGGGDSQGKLKKGGDVINDNSNRGIKREINQSKGKNGRNKKAFFILCGGGGGNGYYGGNGGEYGNKKEVGGGEGGSNYCNPSFSHCFPGEINYFNYSGFEIFKKIKY